MIYTGKPFFYAINLDKITLVVKLQYTGVLGGYLRILVKNIDDTITDLYLPIDDIELLTKNAYEIPIIDKNPHNYILF